MVVLRALPLLVALFVSLPTLAQPKGSPSVTSEGGTTFDLLVDLAASAPAQAASSTPGSKPAANDSRERLLEQLKKDSSLPSAMPVDTATAASPLPSLPGVDAASTIAGTRSDSVTPAEAAREQVQQIEAASEARKRPGPAADNRPHIAEDSWIRTVAYWIRDNRTWFVVITLLALAILWGFSAMFTRAGSTGSRALAADASREDWPLQANPVTRSARHRRRSHRPRS